MSAMNGLCFDVNGKKKDFYAIFSTSLKEMFESIWRQENTFWIA